MGIHYQWLDGRQIIMALYIEDPWTWAEYNETIAIVIPKMVELNQPCATLTETSKFKIFPKDGSPLEILKSTEAALPPTVFASAVVAPSYSVRVFMNIMMKLRPNPNRIAFFASTLEEAKTRIYARYKELYPDLAPQ